MSDAFPYHGNFNFLVEIDGPEDEPANVVGGFSQVSGLSSQSDVLEYKTGDQARPVKLPGRLRYGNVVLSRGVTSSAELYRWRRRVEDGQDARRSGAIVLLDASMRETARWSFWGAWPARYDGPLLDAQDAAISVETLELSIEKLERVETSGE